MWFCQQGAQLREEASHLQNKHLLVHGGVHSDLGVGEGRSHKPCTNLRSGTIQVYIFTEFTVSRKTPYPRAVWQRIPAVPTVCPHASVAAQTLSGHRAVQLRTTCPSFPCCSCGHVTRPTRGTRFHPPIAIVMITGLRVP